MFIPKFAAEPSALLMILFGAIWVYAANSLRKRAASAVAATPNRQGFAKEIETAMKSSDSIFVKIHEDADSRDLTVIKWASRR